MSGAAETVGVAIAKNDTAMLRRLLDSGADANALATFDDTSLAPLAIAAALNRAHHIPTLVAAGADLEDLSAHGCTPLQVAVVHGHAEAITALLRAGAAVNLGPNVNAAQRFNPIHIAVMRNRALLIPELVATGADIDAVAHGTTNLTALRMIGGDLATLEAVLAAGASDDLDAMHLAAIRGRSDVVARMRFR